MADSPLMPPADQTPSSESGGPTPSTSRLINQPQGPLATTPASPDAPLTAGGGPRNDHDRVQPELQVTKPADGELEVTIDGRTVSVPKHTLLLDAATKAGVHIPIYCAHSKMEPVAVCRMCLVQVEKMPKLQPACATYVSDGMVAHTETAQVSKAREGTLEFLLLNHPLDCPVCDRGGECDLQDFAFRYGPNNSRFPITDKVHFDKAVPLSDRIELDNERCILCWRCVRFYDEITGEKEIVLQERGVHTVVATFDGEPLKSEFQGNLPEVCPVGALTHRQYRFKARPWDLQRTRSVCPECSYGCNINVDTRQYEVKRFASRDNPAVDDMWLCDRGRYSADQWNHSDRQRLAGVREGVTTRLEDTTVETALARAAEQLGQVRDQSGGEAIGVLASAMSTNEELWLLQRFAREVLGTPNIDHQLEAFDGLSPAEHSLGIAEIEECTAVVVLGEEPERNAPVLTLRLRKAEHKRGVAVHRVPVDADLVELAASLRGARLVGVIADERDRKQAASAIGALAGITHKRLTVTRGVNGRGAKDLGVLPNLLPGYVDAEAPGLHGEAILTAAAEGRIKGLFLLNAETLLASVAPLAERALRACPVVVAITSRPGLVTRHASVVLPGHTYLEKQGTVTNMEGRVQRIRQALPPATASPGEARMITMLARKLNAEGWEVTDPVRLNRAMCAAVPAYLAAGNGGRALWNGDGG